ncbi:UPF0323 family lipoprotein [Sulfurospirillum arcachonense]|uniref:UPF0323 family lipoprotein n=1 Tax=Sulfurospirillum arcachonense TaxID=57666 RepID=UPI000468FBB4|nr:UPF0323 family lipoprotein [Sulfurospirillum arcachonense]
MNKKYIRKISDYMIAGGIGAMVIAGMQGCEQKSDDNAFTEASKVKGAFVVIEQLENGGYTIVEEYPSNVTRVIVRYKDGTEKMLTKEEMDKLVKEESLKIDNGTSSLTDPSLSNGAPGLGHILLSSVAGAMLGSYIGNRLFNNQNYQAQRRTSYKSPQAYSRSTSSFNKARTSGTTSTKKKSSGFFGSKSSSRSKSLFGFGG